MKQVSTGKRYPITRNEAKQLITSAEYTIKSKKADFYVYLGLGSLLEISLILPAVYLIFFMGGSIRETLLILPLVIPGAVMIGKGIKLRYQIAGLEQTVYNLEKQIHLLN